MRISSTCAQSRVSMTKMCIRDRYISGKALLILIAAVVLTMNGLRQRDLFLYTPEEIYMNYVNQLLGEVTDEKIAFIEKEREDIDSCDEKIAQLSEQYYNGEISYAQFSSESMILTNSREARSEPFELCLLYTSRTANTAIAEIGTILWEIVFRNTRSILKLC